MKITERLGRFAGRAGAAVRRCRAPLAVLVALGGYGLMLPTGWIYASTSSHRVGVAEAAGAPVAIVLGAQVAWDRPSPFLAGRLDVAGELYRSGKVAAILVTGDNSTRSYDEPTVMMNYLVERQGVPTVKIVRDYAGFDTWDSCVRARRIFGVDRAIVVTQRFHVPRAVALCRAAGIEAEGVGHDSLRDHKNVTYNGYAREVLASFKAVADVAGRPSPRFLGPPEPGIRRALATP